MNKFFTAVIVTVNLIALPTLSVARPVQAKTAQMLAPLEEVGLSVQPDGDLEM